MLTQDQIIAAYEQAIENQPSAGQDVTEASESIDRALDNYCTALQYETFLWAYELGYKARTGGMRMLWITISAAALAASTYVITH